MMTSSEYRQNFNLTRENKCSRSKRIDTDFDTQVRSVTTTFIKFSEKEKYQEWSLTDEHVRLKKKTEDYSMILSISVSLSLSLSTSVSSIAQWTDACVKQIQLLDIKIYCVWNAWEDRCVSESEDTSHTTERTQGKVHKQHIILLWHDRNNFVSWLQHPTVCPFHRFDHFRSVLRRRLTVWSRYLSVQLQTDH